MRILAASCVALVGLLVPALGHAEVPGATTAATTTPAKPARPTPDGPVVVPGENDEPQFQPIPNEKDELGGHLLLGASIGPKWFFGALNDQRSQQSELGPALAFNIDAGVGVSRSVSLGLWGEFDDHSAPWRCPDCAGKSFAAGPFLRYHTVQGTRFDPWGSLSLGVRRTSIDNGGTNQEHFTGFDLLRLTIGADWYATSGFALGPYLELDMGNYGSFGWDSLHTNLGTGLRFSLNLPGR